MVIKRKKKRAAPPAELPGRWLRSKSGRSYSYIIETKDRSRDGEVLYKLQSLMYDFVDARTGLVRHLSCSEKRWTKADLEATGRFLKNAPTKSQISKAKAIPYS